MSPSPPRSRRPWQPGPSGRIEPTTVEQLSGFAPNPAWFPAGDQVAVASGLTNGWPYTSWARIIAGRLVGVLVVRWAPEQQAGEPPELVDVAVDPAHRRQGIARGLCESALAAGIDLREAGTIWDGPLTAEGRRLRDSLANDVGRYGHASWQRGAAA